VKLRRKQLKRFNISCEGKRKEFKEENKLRKPGETPHLSTTRKSLNKNLF